MSVARSIKAVYLLLISLALISCTFGPKPVPSENRNLERLLTEAGFVKNMADTQEKMARINSEIQRKVIPVQEAGRTFYLYADADICRCLYVGDENAFSRFEELLYREDLEREACIDERLRSAQTEPWREFGTLGELCRDRP